MAQLHLYVPDDVAAEVARKASSRGLSVSKYLAELVKKEVSHEWPPGFFDEVVGGWVGDPMTRAPQGRLELRDEL